MLILSLRNDRAVVILNVIAIAYVTRIGSNLLNDIIVTYVPPRELAPCGGGTYRTISCGP